MASVGSGSSLELDPVIASGVENILAYQAHLKGVPTPNPLCIVEHCLLPAIKCGLNRDCRSGLACTAGCGTQSLNQTCVFQCTSDFENDVYDNLLHCMFTEHDCMKWDQPFHWDAMCKSTSETQPVQQYMGKPLTAQLARDLLRRSVHPEEQGYWLVAQGLSKAYDCFDCQNIWFNTWDESPDRLIYDAIYKIHKSDGVARWNHAKYNASSAFFKEAGHMLLFAQDYGGLAHQEDWRILAIDERKPNDPEWIALYYCGGAVGVKEAYEGSCLITPTGVLPEDAAEVKKINAAYAAAGVSPQCFPNNSADSCKGHPTPFNSASEHKQILV